MLGIVWLVSVLGCGGSFTVGWLLVVSIGGACWDLGLGGLVFVIVWFGWRMSLLFVVLGITALLWCFSFGLGLVL